MDKEQKSKAFGSLDREFETKCMKEKTITVAPTVSVIDQEKVLQAIARQHESSSGYFLQGAKNLLQSNTPLLAILIGFFAMESKANQLIALHGYKVESHVCTQMALSRIVSRNDLAKDLSAVFDKRQDIGYRMTPKSNSEESKNATDIINNKIIPFIDEVDTLIKRI